MPRPVTSPTTMPRRPSGIANASYQSPPTCAAEPGDVVGGGQLDAADLGKALGDQAALELDRDAMLLLVQLGAADRQRGAVGGVLEQRPLGGGERRAPTAGRGVGSRRSRPRSPAAPRASGPSSAPARPRGTGASWPPEPRARRDRIGRARRRSAPRQPRPRTARPADSPAEAGTRRARACSSAVREVLELRQPLGHGLRLHARGLLEQQLGAVLLGPAPQRSDRPTAPAAAARRTRVASIAEATMPTHTCESAARSQAQVERGCSAPACPA